MYFFFFFKQKTAYEMRISDWSSDVCSSDLASAARRGGRRRVVGGRAHGRQQPDHLPRALAFDRVVRGVIGPRVAPDAGKGAIPVRSEERRVGKECVSTCRSRWSPYH